MGLVVEAATTRQRHDLGLGITSFIPLRIHRRIGLVEDFDSRTAVESVLVEDSCRSLDLAVYMRAVSDEQHSLPQHQLTVRCTAAEEAHSCSTRSAVVAGLHIHLGIAVPGSSSSRRVSVPGGFSSDADVCRGRVSVCYVQAADEDKGTSKGWRSPAEVEKRTVLGPHLSRAGQTKRGARDLSSGVKS